MAESTEDLWKLVGARVKALREARGMRQQDLVQAVRLSGLDWTRSALASVEIGRREIHFPELLILTMALDCPLVDLFQGEGWAQLTPGAAITLEGIRASLVGEAGPASWSTPAFRSWAGVTKVANFLEHEPFHLLWPDATEGDLVAVAEAAEGPAEQHTARRLQVSPIAVALASFGRWGRGLSEERDRLVSERSKEDDPRTLQALRGHVTRELVAGLEEPLRVYSENPGVTERRAHAQAAEIADAAQVDDISTYLADVPTTKKKRTTTKKGS